VIVISLQARHVPDRAVHIDGHTTTPADKMMVIVVHPILVTRRRARRLDAPDEPLVGQKAQGVMDGLTRHRPDIGPDQLLDLISCRVRLARHRPQDGQTLRRHLDTPRRNASTGSPDSSVTSP
jgi:hypothetical protein